MLEGLLRLAITSQRTPHQEFRAIREGRRGLAREEERQISQSLRLAGIPDEVLAALQEVVRPQQAQARLSGAERTRLHEIARRLRARELDQERLADLRREGRVLDPCER